MANAPQMLAFYYRGFHAKLRRADGRYIPTGPAADENCVEGYFCHRFPLQHHGQRVFEHRFEHPEEFRSKCPINSSMIY